MKNEIEKVWYQDYFPIGMVIKGETLKELAEKELFDIAFSSVNESHIPAGEEDFSQIEDDETWIIGLNTNTNTVMFVQLFTTDKVVIETTTKPEVKKLPPYDFAYAL